MKYAEFPSQPLAKIWLPVFFLVLTTQAGARLQNVNGVPNAIECKSISVVADGAHEADVRRVAEVFAERVKERSGGSVDVTTQPDTSNDLLVVMGIAGDGGAADTLVKKPAPDGVVADLLATNGRAGLPAPDGVAPEGFLVHLTSVDAHPAVVVLGADRRGLLYGAAELLRRITYAADGISIDRYYTNVASAPAYRFRGSSANQGGTMQQITGARSWTQQEREHYMIDLALSGANILYADGAEYDFVKSFDLMTVTGCRPNQLADHPAEWQATERGPWVCPSIPDARAALLAAWDADFAQRKDHDIMRMYAGDPGGCRCERCEPWGKTFVELCAEVAAIWLKHHPNSIVQIANQDLSNEGDLAIFEYFRAEPRAWCHGIAYGPGSNAMSDYFRSELRDDLFVYPRKGPVNRYLAETLHQLPPQQTITHYSDITHWVSAQYEIERPDPHIMKIYGRRTFHARPKDFYDIFQSITPFSEGDIIYSEGYHDEFHQYMWNRLLWNPNQSLDDVTLEYCRYQFGEEAADDMRQALYQLEKNLKTGLAYEGVQQFYDLVKSAGGKIPEYRMEADHKWRLHMQKADLDLYYQKKLQNELARAQEVRVLLSAAKPAKERISTALAALAEPLVTEEMTALYEEAGRLGEESNRIFGVRNVGYFSADKPLTDLAWLERELKALQEMSEEDAAAGITRIVHYESPGDGGFYDDAGDEDRQPHLVAGDTYDASAMMDPTNRQSQNTIAYSLSQPAVVAFRYTDLDPHANYVMRATLVMPRIPRQMMEVPVTPKRALNVLADDDVIAENFEIAEYTAQQYEFEIPRDATADGVLELSFTPGEGAFGVVVSEVWLLKK